MADPVFYAAGTTEACIQAAKILESSGIAFLQRKEDIPTDLLLDVPSFRAPGILRSGEDFGDYLKTLPPTVRVWGGRLSCLPPALQRVDLLEDPGYLAQNAAITADCALRLCGLSLRSTWQDAQVLVIGWGRIGKQLCRMLKSLGAKVTVCARKAPDRALLNAFGYPAIEPEQLEDRGYQVIFNTAPDLLLAEELTKNCPVPMDLSSHGGLLGDNIIHAGGLPGIYAPLSSGRLIADRILQKLGR